MAFSRPESKRVRIQEDARVSNGIVQQPGPQGFGHQFMSTKLEQVQAAKIEVGLEGLRERAVWKEQLVAPIDTLPPEILSEIFLVYVDVSIDGCPSILSSVSSRWRDIAHVLPNLWTRLTVSHPVTATAFFHRLHRHFGLSRDAPLTLTIQHRITYLPADIEPQVLKTTFTNGKHHLSCIKVLDVDYKENYRSTLIHEIMRNACSTCDLTLRVTNKYFRFYIPDIKFKSVLRLRLLLLQPTEHYNFAVMRRLWSLVEIQEDIHPRLGPYFELDRMTELTGFPMSHDFWLNFMRTKCGSLQRGGDFIIDHSLPRDHSTLSQSFYPIIVPNLHTLSVAILSNTEIPVFRGLSLPSLRNLVFMADVDYDREDSNFNDELIHDHSTISSHRIHSFILGPGIAENNFACFTVIDAPMLEHLYIRDVKIRGTRLVSLMRNLPNLRSLTARTVLTDFRPLVATFYDSVLNDGDFLPNITRIVLQDQHHPWVDEASFQRILGRDAVRCPQ